MSWLVEFDSVGLISRGPGEFDARAEASRRPATPSTREQAVHRLSHALAVFVIVAGTTIVGVCVVHAFWWGKVVASLSIVDVISFLGIALAGLALRLSVPSNTNPSVESLRLAVLLLTAITAAFVLLVSGGCKIQLMGDDYAALYASCSAISGHTAFSAGSNLVLVIVALALIDREWLDAKWSRHWPILSVAGLSLIDVFWMVLDLGLLHLATYQGAFVAIRAMLFLMLAIGIICARPSSGLISYITSDNSATNGKRVVMALTIIGPALLAWLAWNGGVFDYHSVSLGFFIYIALIAIVIVAFIWWCSEATQAFEQEQLSLRQSVVWQQAILDNAEFTVICTNIRGMIRTLNNGAARKLGFSQEELVNQSVTETIHIPAELAARAKVLTQELGRSVSADFEALTARARLSGSDECEWTFRGKDGQHFQVRQWVSPLLDGRRKICGFVAIGMDITRQRSAALALQESLGSLDARNRELQEFAFVASHDLQEPLRKIRVFSDRLLAEYSNQLDERATVYLTRNIQAATRMQTLIDDLMAYSRVSTHGSVFDMIDLNAIVAATVDDLEVRLEASAGRVEWCGLPTVVGDPSQLRQVFQNLISNALKFRHSQRTPVVRVTSQFLSDASSSPGWSICVEDNGIGFDPTHAERIFAPFQRLHGRAEYEGTGIGLAIVRRIVERHGGHVSACGAEGVGAVFTMFLPLITQRS
jgi:PAS domain S-box-containing protein